MRRYILAALLLSIVTIKTTSQNLVTIDEKPFHFGFTLGLNAMDFGFTPSLAETSQGIYNIDIATIIPGFTVGVIGDLRLGNYFNLRAVPAMHFGQRNLSFVNTATQAIEVQTVKSNVLNIPFYLKYSSVRVDNYRPYLIVGGGVSFDLGRERENPVLLQQMDYFVDFGVGWTIYFPFFRLSPEIKFSLGFNNMITPLDQRTNDFIADGDKHYTQSISRLTSRLVTFTLNFE